MLDLRRLRLLREFAANGTVAATADALHFSRSSVSQQLALLEREVNVQLFERVGRNLRLTDAGWTLVHHAEAILERAAHAEADLETMHGEVRGTIRVGIFQTAAIWILPRALLLLRERHPSLVIEVLHSSPGQALPELQRGALDVVIGQSYDLAPESIPPGLTHRHLAREPVVVALPRDHPMAGTPGPIELASLADDVFAAGEAGTGFGDLTLRLCAEVGGFTPTIRYRSPDFTVLLALVRNGLAVAIVPGMVSEVDPSVTIKEIGDGTVGRDVFAAVRGANENRPAVAAVVAAIHEVVAELTTSNVSTLAGPDARA